MTTTADAKVHRWLADMFGPDAADLMANPLDPRQRKLTELVNNALGADGSPSDQGLHAILADEDRLTAYLDAAELVAR